MLRLSKIAPDLNFATTREGDKARYWAQLLGTAAGAALTCLPGVVKDDPRKKSGETG